MKNTHILIFEHDVLKYPPILSIINFLFSENKKVVLIGCCDNQEFLNSFILRGGIFHNVIENDTNENKIIKMFKYIFFKKKVKKILLNYDYNNCKLWFFGEKCIWLLHSLVYKFDSNLYLFEIPSFQVSLKYKMLSLKLDYKDVLQKGTHVVCCEYNRAHITKSYYNLDRLPLIVPNKPHIDNDLIENDEINKIIKGLFHKKVILYQGVFNYPERRLDEFCQAIKSLPEDYVLCLMGSENKYKTYLESKYKTDRIIFLPYVSSPNHLIITKLAYIGVLVYNSEDTNIKNSLNTLYCAPNKIYEYAKFGIPMISNDVPALSFVFDKYHCGKVIRDFSIEEIIIKIKEIEDDYSSFTRGASEFYNEIDLKDLYLKLI